MAIWTHIISNTMMKQSRGLNGDLNTYTLKHYDETKQRTQWRSEHIYSQTLWWNKAEDTMAIWTHILSNTMMKQSRGLNGDLNTYNHKHYDETKQRTMAIWTHIISTLWWNKAEDSMAIWTHIITNSMIKQSRGLNGDLNTYNHKHYDETKQRTQWRSEHI